MNHAEHGGNRIPTTIKSCEDCAGLNAGNIRPLRDGFFASKDREDAIGSSVSRLLFGGRPSNITRFVSTGVHDSIKAVGGTWSLPNVLKERLKRFAPSLANRYAARAILVVAVAGWVVASLLHCGPYVIQSMMTPTMFQHTSDQQLDSMASATFRPAAGDGVFTHVADCSASTNAGEVWNDVAAGVDARLGFSHNRPVAKGLSLANCDKLSASHVRTSLCMWSDPSGVSAPLAGRLVVYPNAVGKGYADERNRPVLG